LRTFAGFGVHIRLFADTPATSARPAIDGCARTAVSVSSSDVSPDAAACAHRARVAQFQDEAARVDAGERDDASLVSQSVTRSARLAHQTPLVRVALRLGSRGATP